MQHTTSSPTAAVRRVAAAGARRARQLRRKVRSSPSYRRHVESRRRLEPAQALQQNGFYVFRGLFDAATCARLAAQLKADFDIHDETERTSIDAASRFATAREMLLDDRIIDSVRAALGDGARFLQVADVQYNHDHVKWHRDSPYRDADSSTCPDWNDRRAPYRVAKIIVYLESENAGMGMLPGSHLTPIAMDEKTVAAQQKAGNYNVIALDDEPNRRFTPEELARPTAWAAATGDALVFDERMYHCGRRIEGRRVISNRDGKKMTVSFVFGDDNAHSARMYSYFRYARTDLKYRPLPDDLLAELTRRELVPTTGWGNYFEQHPEELRGAYLRDASQMDELIDRFSRAAAPR